MGCMPGGFEPHLEDATPNIGKQIDALARKMCMKGFHNENAVNTQTGVQPAAAKSATQSSFTDGRHEVSHCRLGSGEGT